MSNSTSQELNWFELRIPTIILWPARYKNSELQKQVPSRSSYAMLRPAVIRFLGEMSDEAVLAEANRRFAAFLEDPTSLRHGLRDTVIHLAGFGADRNTYEVLLSLARFVLWLLRRMLSATRSRLPSTIRHGLANLYRPGNQSATVLAALGTGIMLVTTVFLVNFMVLPIGCWQACARGSSRYWCYSSDTCGGDLTVTDATAYRDRSLESGG